MLLDYLGFQLQIMMAFLTSFTIFILHFIIFQNNSKHRSNNCDPYLSSPLTLVLRAFYSFNLYNSSYISVLLATFLYSGPNVNPKYTANSLKAKTVLLIFKIMVAPSTVSCIEKTHH